MFTGADLQSAEVIGSTDGLSAVGIRLYSGAAEVFQRFTHAHRGERMALVVNHVIILVPQITSEISGGTLQVSGGGSDPETTRQSAEALLKQLNTPAKL